MWHIKTGFPKSGHKSESRSDPLHMHDSKYSYIIVQPVG